MYLHFTIALLLSVLNGQQDACSSDSSQESYLIWWDWPLTWLTNDCPSVLWCCWLGHLTHKIVPGMTYDVSSVTLNPCYAYTNPVLLCGRVVGIKNPSHKDIQLLVQCLLRLSICRDAWVLPRWWKLCPFVPNWDQPSHVCWSLQLIDNSCWCWRCM